MKIPIYEIFVDGKPAKLELARTGEKSFTVKKDEKSLNVQLSTDKLDLEGGFLIEVDGKEYHVELPEISREKPFSVKVEETKFQAEVKSFLKKPVFGASEPIRLARVGSLRAQKQAVEGAVAAPMTGKILSIMVEKGDQVKSGQVVCILEAMKMENEITASKAGTVQEVYVSEGSSVREEEVLLVVS